jgi:TonB family protein
MLRFCMCLCALMLATSAQAEGRLADLHPSGPWKVEYANTNCILSRPFTAAGETHEFQLTLEPVVTTGWLRIGSPGKIKGRDDGKAFVEIDGARLAEPTHFNVFKNSKGGMTREFLFANFVKQAGSARASLRLRPGEYGDLFFRLSDFPEAMNAMSACMADLHRSLGIDPALLRSIETPPQGNLFSLIRIPRDADQLTLTLLFWVAPNGRVDDCRVLAASGRPELDANVCPRLLKDGRYTPARNSAGVPIRAPVYEAILLRRQIIFQRSGGVDVIY